MPPSPHTTAAENVVNTGHDAGEGCANEQGRETREVINDALTDGFDDLPLAGLEEESLSDVSEHTRGDLGG